MDTVNVFLFGKFEVRDNEAALNSLKAHKAQELFSYLVLNRNHPHRREALTDLLWPTSTAAHSMKYFRQTLWQLRTAFETNSKIPYGEILDIDLEWIGINPQARIELDVTEFERIYTMLQSPPAIALL